jgi:hypothetical protein
LTTSVAAQEEESTEKNSREDETLGEFSKSTGFLLWKNCDINLLIYKLVSFDSTK